MDGFHLEGFSFLWSDDMLSKRLTMEDMQLIVRLWLSWKTLLQMEDTPGQAIKGHSRVASCLSSLFFVAFSHHPTNLQVDSALVIIFLQRIRVYALDCRAVIKEAQCRKVCQVGESKGVFRMQSLFVWGNQSLLWWLQRRSSPSEYILAEATSIYCWLLSQ